MAKKKKTRAKRRVMGFMGKAGVMVMAIPPFVGSALAAASHVDRHSTVGQPLSILSKMNLGFSTFTNNLAHGFGFPPVFGDIEVTTEDGTNLTKGTTPNVPMNAWWYSTGLGGVMLLQDRIVAYLLKRPVKLPGTNFVLTGN